MDIDGFQVVTAKRGRSRREFSIESHLNLTSSTSYVDENEASNLDVVAFVRLINCV